MTTNYTLTAASVSGDSLNLRLAEKMITSGTIRVTCSSKGLITGTLLGADFRATYREARS